MLRTHKLVRTIAVITLFEFSVMPSVLSQEKAAEPSFKAQSVNVVVDLIVTDRRGHHVPGLTASDFTIYEDGVAQKIIGFTPAAGSASSNSSPAVAKTDQFPKTAPQQGQTALSPDPHLLNVVLDFDGKPPGQYQKLIRRSPGILGENLRQWRLRRHLLH